VTASHNGQPPASPREAAAYYLGRGFIPVPIPRTGNHKAPALDGWQQLRPTPQDLDGLFPADQSLNLGLLLGEPSGGLLDVDLDCVEAIAAGTILLPDTALSSGRKSRMHSHRWYRVNNPPDKASTSFKDLDGKMLIELRSTGGQTVVWPSVHQSGERVGWHNLGEPSEVPLDELRGAVARTAAAALLARHWPAKGGRQDAALSIAGGLARAGWDGDATDNFVRGVATASGDLGEVGKRCNVGQRTAEKLQQSAKVWGWPNLAELLGQHGKAIVEKVCTWLGIRHEKKKAPIRPPDPYRPFPVEALPEPIHTFVLQGAVALGCDPAYLALPALSVAASLIGNSRVIRLKRNWHEPAVVWSGIVGDSGTLKSPAVSVTVNPLYRLQKRLLKKFQTDMEQYQTDLEAYNERKRKAKKEEQEFTEEPPEKPSLARVVTGDITVEKLAQLLEDNPKGLLVGRDELGGWLGSFTRYKGKAGGSDLPNWLEMSRAGTIQVDRKTGDRPTLFITYAAVSITGGIQPGALARALTPEYMEVGLGARILMAMPPKLPKRWSEVEIDLDVQEAYENLLDGLRDLQMDKGRDGDREPFPVRMTPEAKAAWVHFYGEWARAQANVEGELAAAYSKLEGYAARLALLHHVVTNVGRREDDCQPVEPVSIAAGVTLARWFAYEVRRIYAALGEGEDARQTRRLIEFIRSRGGRMTARRLHLSNKARYPDAEAAEAALGELVEAELADWVEAANPKGGRPSRAVVLRPHTTCFKSYETTDEDDEDEVLDGGDDTTPPPTKPFPPSENQAEPGGFVASEVCSTTNGPPARGSLGNGMDEEVGGSGEGVSEYGPESLSSASPPSTGNGSLSDPSCFKSYETSRPGHGYLSVTDPGDLGVVCAAVEESALVGVDCETTGLNPRSDRVRLLSLNCDTSDGGRFTYLVDMFQVDPRPLWELLAERDLIFHNAHFDLQFLAALGFEPKSPVHDVMILSRLLTAGGREGNALADLTERHLRMKLDKTQQQSDWSGELTDDQLRYAALDVEVLPPLLEVLRQKIKEAGLEQVAEIERRCLLSWLWMATAGLPVDRRAWEDLSRQSRAVRDRLLDELHQLAPPKPGDLPGVGACWNFNSGTQVQGLLRQLGFPVENTKDETLAGIDHALADLLRRYRYAKWLDGTYGEAFLRFIEPDGRIYGTWVQTGNEAGRSSCKEPNLQQIPRQADYRHAFVAAPGKVLIKADFTAAHLRIACKIAGEQKMLAAFREGRDLHRLTAASLLAKPEEEVTKQDRQIAKAVAFGLLYGMGPKTLRVYALQSYGVEMTLAEARRHKATFFETYPGLDRWHRRTDAERAAQTETRTLAGRRRLLDPKTPIMHRLNSPVLGTEADAAKTALALLWERRDACPGARPVAFVHDEVLVEADAGQADAAAAWVKQAMLDAMAPLIDPVPVEVEVRVARSWGGE
jgi:DNA polymerase I-like protein with 3'-5' exonuclease and polymerase domains